MEPIKFQTAYEYDAMNWVHIFHMRMPINGNMVYATTKVSSQMLDYDREIAIQQVKWELAAGIASEIRKQAEQFLEKLDFFEKPKPKPSYHATGPAADILKDVYGAELKAQLSMSPLVPLKLTKKEVEELKKKYGAPASANIDALFGIPVVVVDEPDTHYEDHAKSEFEGVEGLDESLWKDGTDGLI